MSFAFPGGLRLSAMNLCWDSARRLWPLAVGIAAIAVLWAMEGILTRGSGCLDPLLCSEPPTDFLSRWTAERATPSEARWAGLRALAGVGLALGLVLIAVAALNVTTTIVARGAPRRAEYALRTALGASPLRLLRRAGAEAALMIVAALSLGAALGAGAALLLGWSWPIGDPPWAAAKAVPWRPVAAAGLLLLLALAASLWPILVAWRRDLRRHLSVGERATAGPAEAMVRDGLGVIQVAAALVLLVSAGLLVFAFAPGAAAGPQAAPAESEFVVAQLRLPDSGGTAALATPDQRASQYTAIVERVRLFPGVVDSSLATEGSLAGLGLTDRVTALCAECGTGTLPKQQTSGAARIHSVGAGILETLGLDVRRGRSITATDTLDSASVAVISNAFAVNFFPNGEPLGKEIRLGGIEGEWVRVVGIVDDLQVPGLASGAIPFPALYLSILQHPPSRASLVARVTDGEGSLDEGLSAAVAAAVPGAELGPSASLSLLRARERAPLRWFGALFGVLAALVAVLATAGLYSLIAHGVRRRQREIGVRMALGADRRRVLRMVLRKGVRLVAVGVVVGLIPLSGVARMLQLTYGGVDPWNPLLVLFTAVVLLLVALAASYRPGREAARLEPLVVLRQE